MSEQRGSIALVPVGTVEAELMAWLAGRLGAIFVRGVVVEESIALPDGGYDIARGQYEGEALLKLLQARPFPGAERVLGVTDADCYAPGLNFVFGQATAGGREAFVALARLHPAFYGQPEDEELFRERALKECVHELGHTWGLAHCANPACAMHFSNTLHDTDVKGVDFCPRCQRQLAKGQAK